MDALIEWTLLVTVEPRTQLQPVVEHNCYESDIDECSSRHILRIERYRLEKWVNLQTENGS